MNHQKLFALILVVLLLNYNVNAYISIDIDSAELQQLGEMFVQSYIEQSIILSTRLRPRCLKIIKHIAQIGGIMVSLVGANLITSALQPFAMPNSVEPSQTSHIPIRSEQSIPTKLCDQQFGCHRNLCWKGCGNSNTSWCFATPKNEIKKLHACEAAYDCSPCWKCIGVCHTP